jgi:hypothetical protein
MVLSGVAALAACLIVAPPRAYAGVVAGASTPSGNGGWSVTAKGAVGLLNPSKVHDAHFYGDTRHVSLAKPITGIAARPSGKGYWLVARDGGVFGYGDAHFYGSMSGRHLNEPIVAIASTKSGRGYWLAAADGGVFGFGDAKFYGSLGSSRLNEPIVGISTTASGKGYRMVARDGGIFDFGDAKFYGSLAGRGFTNIVGMARTPSGNGYWIARKSTLHDCSVHGCVDLAEPVVAHFGDALDLRLSLPIGLVGPEPVLEPLDAVAIVANPDRQDYTVWGSEGHVAATCVTHRTCAF